jgi:hypothetical protein
MSRMNSGMKLLPPDAVFSTPPVCTMYWDDESWLKWWKAGGSKTKADLIAERKRREERDDRADTA